MSFCKGECLTELETKWSPSLNNIEAGRLLFSLVQQYGKKSVDRSSSDMVTCDLYLLKPMHPRGTDRLIPRGQMHLQLHVKRNISKFTIDLFNHFEGTNELKV